MFKARPHVRGCFYKRVFSSTRHLRLSDDVFWLPIYTQTGSRGFLNTFPKAPVLATYNCVCVWPEGQNVEKTLRLHTHRADGHTSGRLVSRSSRGRSAARRAAF